MGKYLTIVIMLLVVGVYYSGRAEQEQTTPKDSSQMTTDSNWTDSNATDPGMMEGHKMGEGMMGGGMGGGMMNNGDDQKQQDSSTADPNSPHPKTDKGIGPIENVKLGPINDGMAKDGKKVFDQKCTACHRLDTKLVGPALGDVTQKRSPEFIMNFLLNTKTMEAKDPHIRKLESQLGMQMPDPHVDKKQARDLLEYFRSVAPKSEKK